MKLTRLEIKGFGVLNQQIASFSDGVSVVLGANESGKTTLLNFVRFMLDPNAVKKKDIKEYYPPFSSTTHYGAIQLEDSLGRQWHVSMDFGKAKSPLVKLEAAGSTGLSSSATEQWERFTGQLGQNVYRNIYAFSLHELSNLETINQSQVQQSLQAISMGITPQTLSKTRETINKTIDDYHKPRGSKPILNSLVSEYRQNQTENRKILGDLNNYKKLETELENLLREIKLIEQQEKEFVSFQQQLTRDAQNIPHFVEWRELEEKLNELPDHIKAFPTQDVDRVNEIHNELKSLEKDLRQREVLIQDQHTKLNQSQPNLLLLENQVAIEDLARQNESLQKMLNELPLQTNQIESETRRIHGDLNKFHPDWKEADIRAVDCSFTSRKKLDEFSERFRNLDTEVALQQQTVREKEQQEKKIREEIEQLKHDINNDPVLIDLESEPVRYITENHRQFASAIKDLPEIRGNANRTRRDLIRLLGATLPGLSFEQLDESRYSLSELPRNLPDVGQKLEGLITAQTRIEYQLETSQQQFQRSQREVEELTTQVDQGTAESPTAEDINKLSQIQTEWENLDRTIFSLQTQIETNQQTLQQQRFFQQQSGSPKPNWLPSFALTGAGVLFASVLAGFQNYGGAGLVLFFSLLAGVVVYRLQSGSHQQRPDNDYLVELQTALDRLKDQLDQANQKKETLSRTIAEDFEPLLHRWGTPNTPAQLREVIAALQANLARLENQRENLNLLRQRHTKIENDYKTNQQEIENLLKEIEQRQQQWNEWLKANLLPPDLAPSNYLQIRRDIDSILSQWEQLQEYEARQERMLACCQQFQAACDRVNWFNEKQSVPPGSQQPTHPSEASNDIQPGDQTYQATLQLTMRFLEFLDQQKQLQIRQNQRRAQIENRQRELAALAQDLAQLNHSLTNLQNKQFECEQEWQHWLTEHHFPGELKVDAAKDFLQTTEKFCQAFDHLKSNQQELHETQKWLADFTRKATDLLHRLGWPPVENQNNWPQTIELLTQELEEHRTRSIKQQDCREELDRLESIQNQQTVDRDNLDLQLKQLFEKAGADNLDTYLAMNQTFQKMQEIVAQQTSLKNQILAVDSGADFADLVARYQKLDLVSVETQLTETQSKIEAVRSEINRQRQKVGELQEKLRNLSTDDLLQQNLSEEQRIRYQLMEGVQTWLKYKLAHRLLKEGCTRYESERQPKVLQAAEKFFGEVSGYAKVQSDLENNGLRVVDGNHQTIRTPDQLSRGTMEQLYLAIRFGYIEQYENSGEKWPIIMDDILVNFDHQRTEKAIAMICQFAADRQVIFFTCHPKVAEMFKQSNPQVNLFHLQNGRLSKTA